MVQSQVESYQMVLDAPASLNIQHYKERVECTGEIQGIK